MPRPTLAILARRLGVGTALLAISLAAALSAPARAAEAPPAFTVTISNMAYQGIPATAKVGDTISWTNRDSVPHTATAEDGTFDVIIPAGTTKTLVLTKAGTFKFYCSYHPMMQAALAVAASAP